MRLILRILKWLGILILVLLAAGYAWLYYLTSTASVSTHGSVDLNFGNIRVPSERTRAWESRSALTDSILTIWAEREIKDWMKDGKVTIPRALVGRLALRRDVPWVNEFIVTLQPRGTTGSTGPFNKKGDYDFTLAGLSLLLYQFGDLPDVLYPETVAHIVDVLMTKEGGDPDIYTPGVLWLPLRDTENHILMTEGSRYLKNRWKALHGNPDPRYDNATNGLEHYLLDYLGEIERAGIYEYNSRPYQGYMLTALMNLEAFADEPVRRAARRVLDRANWDYALSSLTFRRFPPFRRQPAHAKDTDLDGDYHTGIMKTWMSTGGVEGLFVRKGEHQALWPALLPYRPADAVAEWVQRKPAPYFIRMGHGADGSPEIYSGGPGYLISAGGLQIDRIGQTIARPTTLIFDDDEMDLSGLLHVAGPGTNYRQWNNTGVHRNFAVAAGPVKIPQSWTPVVEDGAWHIFSRMGKHIVTCSMDSLGLFALFHEGNPEQILRDVREANPHPAALETRFRWPSGNEISYDVKAPKNRWVIVTADGHPVNRDHTTWPLMNGDVPGFVVDPRSPPGP